MDHEDFEKLCATAFRIIAATHNENCNCPCSFCDICSALSYISVSWLMEHLADKSTHLTTQQQLRTTQQQQLRTGKVRWAPYVVAPTLQYC